MAIRDAERLERIQLALREARLDALVCALPSNVLLVSGYWPVVGTSVAVATRDGAVGLAVPDDEDDLVLRLRAVLTRRELAQLRIACGVAENGFRAGAARVVPGASEREVAAAFRATLESYADDSGEPAARAGGFVFCMCGPDAALASRAYARTRARRIAPGDLVMV